MGRKRTTTASRDGTRSGYQIGPGMVASFTYTLFDAEGERVEESDPASPLEVLVGYGQTAEGFERALEGLRVDESREVTLAAEEAFGPRDPDAIIEVDRAEFSADIAAGDELEADRDDAGGTVLLKVLEVQEDVVVLDTNHPLAGQRVRLAVRITGIRPASGEELEAAAAQLLREEAAEESGPLLPAERLLKRGRGEPAREGEGPPPDLPPKRLA